MPKAAFDMDNLDWRYNQAQELCEMIAEAMRTPDLIARDRLLQEAIEKLEAIMTAIELRREHLGPSDVIPQSP